MLQPLIALVCKVELKRHSIKVSSSCMLMWQHILMYVAVRLKLALYALRERLAWCCCERSLVETPSSTNATSHSSMVYAKPLLASLG